MSGREQGGGVSRGILLVIAVVLIHVELRVHVAGIYGYGDSLVVVAQILHVAVLRDDASGFDVDRIFVQQEAALDILSAFQHRS